jgi:hypothetical protein
MSPAVRAQASRCQGLVADAITLYKCNVTANPHSANAYDGLADGYAEAGQWKEAATASERAAELAAEFDVKIGFVVNGCLINSM